ncbi:alpha-(1-_3)-arabinofuranosyltransferase [Streptomyces sp. N2-109]|uniref:Alpha-(1->3)-arabinofuranosyltransferase n=1 Tax=Streptomyces gossypii TaxID=2883101 RepID=A0ABT2JR32_9ACTN|nr:alpha-(1->3)-arabinofuranosyltransferase [Streptomyces gossypii]MCT2590281.1 alpha-(1->3)-arabinofuranosyltransferase [Streptomyces gossypii]
MTSSAISPPAPVDPGRPHHARAAGTPPPEDRPRDRRWLLGFWLTALVGFLVNSPGKMTFDTKLGVVTDPWRFISDLGGLWQDQAGFGGISDQYIGYAFPMLPYYALTDLLQIPTWLAERLWLSLIVTAAFWGALRLAERFGIGTHRSRLVAAAAYALWPTFTIVIGSTSAAALPGAVLPWVILPLTSLTAIPRVAAARSALVIPFMGGVNAASTLASLLPVGLYILSRTGRRRRTLIAWWTPGVVLATLWWIVPLLLLGAYGEDFMPYVEQADATTGTMSATEMLRGAGNWTAYLSYGEPWLPAGWAVATGVVAILGSACAAAIGLAGLARRDLPERRWMLLTVVTVVAITLAGYAGGLGGPFAQTVQDWLDGGLRPFRNIYKFQPGLALALTFGLAHLIGCLARAQSPAADATGGPSARSWWQTSGRRLIPGVAALLILPGLLAPFLKGDILQPGAFDKLPKHWEQTADWLEKNSPQSRAYVTPATAHGIYEWGSPIDQPLDVLAESPWAQRDYVPFGTPGNRRALDAVEKALASGGEVPGLSAFLERAGLYNVVVRNDLDPDEVGYVPPQVVKHTLEESGYRKVKGFGPKMTGGTIPSGAPVEITGLYSRLQAVEIYEPKGVSQPGEVALKPVGDTAVLSGGPESLLPLAADPRIAGRPTVLTGDDHPGISNPTLQVQADGLRRADTRFGLVNNNTSATYGPEERNHSDSAQDPGEKPKQILPTEGVKHQTTAELRGAKSVTASSSGNWLFHLPQFEPVNAFDRNPDTAWAEGTAGEAEGQWVRIDFDGTHDIPSRFKVTPLPGGEVRAMPTSVRVETDKGTADSPLQRGGGEQEIKAPAGAAKWLKVTITGTEGAQPGLAGAGFSEISIPKLEIAKLLKLPEAADNGDAGSELVSLHRTTDPGGLLGAPEESGIRRQFTTERADDYELNASALAVPGEALDKLLDEFAPGSRNRLTATAESTSRLSPSTSPRSLVDTDLTTAWIAGSDPTVRLQWPEKTEITEIVLAGAGGITARPTEVRISSPDGATTTSVDENGWARFDPMETDSLEITVTETEQKTVYNPYADKDLQLPVGLTEIHIPALKDKLRARPADRDEEFTIPCREGPTVRIDKKLHTTKVSGKISDLTERKPIDVELCAGSEEDGSVALGSGEHTVETGGAGPLAIMDLTLSRGTVPAGSAGSSPAAGDGREVSATDWSGDRRKVQVGEGGASYLQTHQNVNDGWKATLDGKELTPLRIDGWQQGFLIPEGKGGLVELEYEPVRWYEGGLIAGGIALAALLGLAFLRRREGTPLGEDETPGTSVPAPSWVLGTLALTLVLAFVAGPYALIVPVLALAAWFRPGLLVPTALFAMLGAGVAAAIGAGTGDGGIGDGEGTFGHTAQALALLAVAAALVTLPRPDEETGRKSDPVLSPDVYGPPPTGFDGAQAPTVVLPGAPTPPLGTPYTPPPLPQRQAGEHPQQDPQQDPQQGEEPGR